MRKGKPRTHSLPWGRGIDQRTCSPCPLQWMWYDACCRQAHFIQTQVLCRQMLTDHRWKRSHALTANISEALTEHVQKRKKTKIPAVKKNARTFFVLWEAQIKAWPLLCSRWLKWRSKTMHWANKIYSHCYRSSSCMWELAFWLQDGSFLKAWLMTKCGKYLQQLKGGLGMIILQTLQDQDQTSQIKLSEHLNVKTASKFQYYWNLPATTTTAILVALHYFYNLQRENQDCLWFAALWQPTFCMMCNELL